MRAVLTPVITEIKPKKEMGMFCFCILIRLDGLIES